MPAGGRAADLEAVEKFLGRNGHGLHGLVEHLAVVNGRGAEPGDLADVLQGRGPDVLVGDLGGGGRTEGLDAAEEAAWLGCGRSERWPSSDLRRSMRVRVVRCVFVQYLAEVCMIVFPLVSQFPA